MLSSHLGTKLIAYNTMPYHKNETSRYFLVNFYNYWSFYGSHLEVRVSDTHFHVCLELHFDTKHENGKYNIYVGYTENYSSNFKLNFSAWNPKLKRNNNRKAVIIFGYKYTGTFLHFNHWILTTREKDRKTNTPNKTKRGNLYHNNFIR